MEYVCKVGTPAGEVLEQTFTASDESALRAELEQKGYYLFSVRRALGLKGLGVRQAHIPNDLLLIFGQELAALLKAGLPLVQSLDVMLERQKHPVFKRSLTVIREKVKSGLALSEAFRAEGQLYPPILAASLIAGERSGNLEDVLRRFSPYLRLNAGPQEEGHLRRRLPADAVRDDDRAGGDHGGASSSRSSRTSTRTSTWSCRCLTARPHGRLGRLARPTSSGSCWPWPGAVVFAVSWLRREASAADPGPLAPAAALPGRR